MAKLKSTATKVEGGDFVIVELTDKGPKPVYDGDGQLLRFTDGETAAITARKMTTTAQKYQPRRVKDDTWRQREEDRFASKEYKTLPWHDHVWWKAHKRIWGDHYPHVSQKNSVGLMAFTESDEKGSADLQTALKPGKYLERYFSEVLDQYIIRDLCTTFSQVFEDNCLLFASTEDEFEQLYTEGPTSCMSHPRDKFISHIHPVRTYAAGDLQLAYMKRDSRIVARALVWPEKKIFSRIYGDAGRIEPLLKAAGYRSGTPFGARLQRVATWENKTKKSGNRAFVVPHIDNCAYVHDTGEYLLVGGGSDNLPGRVVKLVGASGITEWVSLHCRCGKECTQSELTHVYINNEGGQERWCQDCIDEGAFRCKQTGVIVDDRLAVVMYDGNKWWAREFMNGGFTCKGDGKNYPRAMAMAIKDAEGRTMVVSKRWYRDAKCETCTLCHSTVVAGGCNESCKQKHAEHKARQQERAAKWTQTSMTYTTTSTNTLLYRGQ